MEFVGLVMNNNIQPVAQEKKKMTRLLVGVGFFLGLLCVFFLFINCRDFILTVIKEGGIVFLGNPDFMSFLVILMILVGAMMCIHSLYRMYQECELLDDRIVNNLKDYKNADPRACHDRLGEMKKRESLLYKRLDVILAGINYSVDKKLPSMQDLHEITVQRELSRWDSAGMNTIISFLLIFGILGTLTGVHEVLNKEGGQLTELAPALTPSAWSVMGTIILMICRAWYLRRVDSFLGRLDAVTMNVILPSLSQGNQQNPDKMWDSLVDNLIGLEALSVPRLEEDTTLKERWETVKVEVGKTTSTVEQLLPQLEVPLIPALPLPPPMPHRHIAPFSVKEALSLSRIGGGAELSKLK